MKLRDEDFPRLRSIVPLDTSIWAFKAAESVTFDLLILELMFLFFKNTVK